MKKLVFLFVAMSLFSCQKEVIQKEPIPIEISLKAQEILRANNQFGFDVLKKVFESDGSQNLMISPLSISQALSMTYNGAAGDTKTAFENVLHFDGQTRLEVNQSALELTKALLEIDKRVDISIANSIWYKQGFTVESEFIDANKEYYNAEVSALDFANSNSKNIINNWVDDKTNHKIPQIIDAINPEDRMFLINAIYFKGVWKFEIDKNNTENKPFYLADGSVKNCATMFSDAEFSVFYGSTFSAIELPYGQGNYSMIILLPTDDSSLNELLSQLDEPTWNDIIQNMSVPTSKLLFLPKFKFEYENELNDELIDLGLGNAFSDSADFSDICKDESLAISKVKHKTFIEVNEEGTEAAAVTSVSVGATSAGPTRDIFAVDHPFLFAIKEKYTNAILFVGTVSDPD
ncbi:MAG: serpin family protein [Bacteroidales bacterium]|nr:serpin family protein [Bacteroidales bacterium]